MRITSITIERRQVGWLCQMYFNVTSAKQFTDECHFCEEVAKTALGALWKAWRVARRAQGSMRAVRRQRALYGWN